VPIWARLTVLVAGARSTSSLALFLSTESGSTVHLGVPLSTYFVLTATFTLLGLGLIAGTERDDRASWLGGLLMLIGTPLATPLLLAMADPIMRWLVDIRPEALMGVFLWRFLAEFPSELGGRPGRLAWYAAGLAGAVGAACATVNAAAIWLPRGDPSRWWAPLLATTSSGLYWPLVFGAAVSGFPLLLWRSHVAAGADRRRALIFVGGLIAGLTPFALEVTVEEVWPAYKALVRQPAASLWIGALIFGSLGVVPLVTAYSVLFDRVVEVRVVLRLALQYALARYTVMAVTLVPFLALTVFLVRHRNEALVAILASGPRPILLGASAGLGLVALRLRTAWLDAVDRRYFREPYDAERVLARVVDDLSGGTPSEIAAQIGRELTRALHANAELFLADEGRAALHHVGDRLPSLDLSARLAELVTVDQRPMDVDLDHSASPLRRLPSAERHWLREGGFSLLVVIRRAGGGVAGILGLTPKRSGLEYSADDRRFLTTVASAAGLALDRVRLRTGEAPAEEPPARECRSCSRLESIATERCACGGTLVMASVPRVLRGVFRIEQRIGAGGMGVVYRAVDLNLRRDVAIKALPRVTPEHVARLRREARAMAVITHPNLAVIHGVETWQGTPFLVQEYLAGGTLARRLAEERMLLDDVFDIGITLAGLLDHLHRSGVVHCDIKPSNIGFTREGVIKLLDFGLARVFMDPQAQRDASTTAVGRGTDPVSSSQTVGPFGTPQFMSPEAVRGERPTPLFDLWALSVVLFEAVAGRRPFEGADGGAVFARILGGRTIDIRETRSDLPDAVVEFFEAALALDASRRPKDARSFGSRIRALRSGNA